MLSLSLLITTSCSYVHRGNRTISLDPVTVISIQYRYDRSTEEMIWQVLRLKKISDWKIRKSGSDEIIEASYTKLSDDMLTEIEERLNQIPGLSELKVKRES